MTDEQFNQLQATLNLLTEAVLDIRSQLQQANRGENLTTPDYHFPLNRYQDFDWSLIGAEVVRSDSNGAIEVLWNQRTYLRRSPQNKFKEAIWFSRSIGKDENDKQQYEQLIMFRDSADADPLPDKTLNAMQSQPRPQNQHPAQPRSKPTKDKKAVYLSVCKALNIVEDADIKALYFRSIHPFNFPKIVLCNNLSDNQFSVMIDNALVDWSITNLLLTEASAIATLNELKATLQSFTPLELAQHWKTLKPVPAEAR